VVRLFSFYFVKHRHTKQNEKIHKDVRRMLRRAIPSFVCGYVVVTVFSN